MLKEKKRALKITPDFNAFDVERFITYTASYGVNSLSGAEHRFVRPMVGEMII